jgi:hypothetical protein
LACVALVLSSIGVMTAVPVGSAGALLLAVSRTAAADCLAVGESNITYGPEHALVVASG